LLTKPISASRPAYACARAREGKRPSAALSKAAEDLETTELRAEWAEADARDAVDFAANAIDEATYAMLDAILARKDMSVLAEEYSERRS
jgi:hypothetical protein